MVQTSPSNAGRAGLIPSLGAKILYALRPKNQNIKQNIIFKNSIKTLKMVHIEKKIFLNHLTQSLTHSKHSVNISGYFHSFLVVKVVQR